MKIGIPKGHNRVCGESQGYQGLPIRDEDHVEGGVLVNAMVTRWVPTPAERELLAAGADIYIRTLGTVPAPIMVGVGDPADGGW